MNYTQPNKLDYEDSPKDWLTASLVYAGALGCLLKENEGVVVDIKNDLIFLMPKIEKVIVFRHNGRITTQECNEENKNLKEGTLVWMD